MEYKYGDITSGIIAASMEVHKELGSGFPEIIYHRSLEMEFSSLCIKYSREVDIPVYYKNTCVGHRHADFLVDDKIIVEIKAVVVLEDVHLAQALNYFEAFNLEIGLLINFGAKSLEFKRLFNRKYNPSQESVIKKVS